MWLLCIHGYWNRASIYHVRLWPSQIRAPVFLQTGWPTRKLSKQKQSNFCKLGSPNTKNHTDRENNDATLFQNEREKEPLTLGFVTCVAYQEFHIKLTQFYFTLSVPVSNSSTEWGEFRRIHQFRVSTIYDARSFLDGCYQSLSSWPRKSNSWIRHNSHIL